MQNAVDAITAASASAPGLRGRVVIEPPEVTGEGMLRIHDNGVGLTEPQVHELLATIERSSKRDELGFARHEFLGQVGIGVFGPQCCVSTWPANAVCAICVSVSIPRDRIWRSRYSTRSLGCSHDPGLYEPSRPRGGRSGRALRRRKWRVSGLSG